MISRLFHLSRLQCFIISKSCTSMPQGDDTESSLVRYSALLRESWLSFQVCNNAQRIYDIWSSPHRTCNAQVVQVNSREEFGILHIEYSHRVSRGTTIQSYAAPSSSPILFVSYTKPVLEVLSLFLCKHNISVGTDITQVLVCRRLVHILIIYSSFASLNYLI